MKRVISGKYKEFEVLIENRIGALANLCELLASNGVNIKAISTDGGSGVKLVTSDERTTRELLSKARVYFEEADVLALKLLDRPGELAKVARMLAKAGINIESVYLLGGDGEKKDIIIKVSNLEQAKKVLHS